MYGSDGATHCPGLAAGALPIGCCSRTISAVYEFPFRERLRREFEVRRNRNARYSLRAFAAGLAQLTERGLRRVALARIRQGARYMPGTEG